MRITEIGPKAINFALRNNPAIDFDTVVGESWRSMHEFRYLDDVRESGSMPVLVRRMFE